MFRYLIFLLILIVFSFGKSESTSAQNQDSANTQQQQSESPNPVGNRSHTRQSGNGRQDNQGNTSQWFEPLVVLNFLLFIAVLIQAYIYNRQRKTMAGQLIVMKDQSDIMKASQKAFFISERAYLTIKKPKHNNKPFEVGKMPEIYFMVVNGGKTPAFDLMCANGTMITGKHLIEVEQEMIDRLGESVSAAYLLGGDHIPAAMTTAVTFPDDALIFAWEAGTIHYYWVSQLSYTDIEGIRETIPFWFEYIPSVRLGGMWTLIRVGERKDTINPNQ